MSNPDTLVMYIRISMEDQTNHTGEKAESNSITNQRRLLKDYIEENPELRKYQVTELCDDGYSGTNLDRPGMKRLLDMIRKRLIGCIMVKDFSRFGRDYLMVSDYIDQIFPFMGIRFISVNDHYDSAACKGMTSGLDMAFRNMLYGYYSQDLSLKIKSAKQTRAENGKFLSPFAPLGYQKMPQNKNQLIIEPEGATIVQKIFALAGMGMSVLQITRWLNQEQIPTPCQVKNSLGQFHKFWNGKGKEKIWDNSVVRDILRDERYLGKNIYGKQARIKVGDFHVYNTSPEDWIRVEHCHEAIVSKTDFDAAQKSIREYIPQGRKTSVPHLFSGKVWCEVCGHSLYYFKAETPYYRCMTWRNKGGLPCINGTIQESELIEVVLSAIQLYVKVLLGEDTIQEKERNEGKITDLKKQLVMLQTDVKKLQERKAILYDKLVDGEISREEFQKSQETLTYQQEKMQYQLNGLQKKLAQLECITGVGREGKKHWKEYLGAKELTREMLEALIDCIYVYQDKSIRIQWKFGDGLMEKE